jgi:hypothetical protein
MDFFLFSGFNRFMHFYVNPWAIRRRVEPGMARTAIGEITQ